MAKRYVDPRYEKMFKASVVAWTLSLRFRGLGSGVEDAIRALNE